MKITILTENIAGSHFGAEHGLSYLIELNGKRILFDTGHSDLFLRNASLLGIDLKEIVDLIVLSHGHWDHGNGLQYMTGKPLLTHPNAFMKRYRKSDQSYIGLAMSKKEIQENFKLTTSKSPLKISKHVFFLGEIPRLNSFEAQTTTFIDKVGNPDYVLDDSALAIIWHNELVIISGCAHSGICNICEHAKRITGINTIHTVIGGFHLKNNDTQTKKTIDYFKHEQIKNIHPSHCTGSEAFCAFQKVFKNQSVTSGQQIEIE